MLRIISLDMFNKNTLLFTISLFSLTSIPLIADNTPPSFANPQENPHHIFFGTEFFGFSLDTHVKDVKMQGNSFFWGLRFGYEYLKPRAFYAGIDILTSCGNNNFKASIGEHRLPKKAMILGLAVLSYDLDIPLLRINGFVLHF